MSNFLHSRILPLVLGSAAVVLASNAPARALTWNWSVADSSGGSGSGTFTTTGTTAIANTQYTVTGVTGTYNGQTLSSTPGTYLGPDNILEWDGSSGFLTDHNGITVNGTSNDLNIYSTSASTTTFDPINTVIYSTNFSKYSLTSANLTPVSSSAVPFEVPSGATIPALGSLLTLGVMRKARKFTSNNFSITVTEKVN